MGFFNYFMTIVIISVFYSFFITSTVYNLQGVDNVNVGLLVEFTESGANLDYGQTSSDFESAINTQTSFGGADLAALALFSGNIIVDLAANFLFAFPNMITLLVTGVFYLIPLNGYLQAELQLWVFAIVSIVSAIFLLQFLLGARTQSLGNI